MTIVTKIVGILAGGLILSFLVVIFLISPLLNSVNLINQNVKEKKTELAILDQQIRAFKNAQIDLAKATRKAEINEAVVIKEDLVKAVKDLEGAADKSDSLELLKINEPVVVEAKGSKKEKPVQVLSRTVAGITEVPYEANTEGDYVGLIKFLNYLEHMPHFTEIGKLDLTAEESETNTESDFKNTGKVFGTIDGAFFIRTPTK